VIVQLGVVQHLGSQGCGVLDQLLGVLGSHGLDAGDGAGETWDDFVDKGPTGVWGHVHSFWWMVAGEDEAPAPWMERSLGKVVRLVRAGPLPVNHTSAGEVSVGGEG